MICSSVRSSAKRSSSPDLWSARVVAFFLALAIGLFTDPATSQEPGARPGDGEASAEPEIQVEDVDSIEALQRFLRQKESQIRSLRLSVRTEISPEPERRIVQDSEVRVLAGTHLHSTMRTVFDDDIELETESVQRPDGNYLREVDPIQGEVFIKMTPEFRERVKEAAAVLATEGIPTPEVSPETDALLGARMVEDMNRSFELTIDGPRTVGGEQVWLVGGPLRMVGEPEDLLGVGADRVSLIIRTRDGLVQQITQFRQGRSVFDARVVGFIKNPELDPATFDIALPAGREWIDVQDHPPAQQQFEELFRLADEIRQDRQPAEDSGGQATGEGGGERRSGGR